MPCPRSADRISFEALLLPFMIASMNVRSALALAQVEPGAQNFFSQLLVEQGGARFARLFGFFPHGMFHISGNDSYPLGQLRLGAFG